MINQCGGEKKKKQKPVIYDILKECSTIVKDDFWIQFYEDLASGKSTKGIYIINGTIQTSNKRSGFSYSIMDKAPEVIVRELHYLLTNIAGICSKKDINKKKQVVKDIEDELAEYEKYKWTSIKRKNIKNMLILNYVIKMNKKYGLTWDDTIMLYKTILNAFEFKTHTSKDVIYTNGSIVGINDIVYDKTRKTMVNTRELPSNSNKNNQKESSDEYFVENLFENYINNWIKHIKN